MGAPFAWCTVCLVGALETSAPPERLLHEYLLNLAVSGANDVQTLLELSNLYAVNSEELCLAVSNLSVDCADAVNNLLYNLESSVVDTTTVVEDRVTSSYATTCVNVIPVYLEADAVCTRCGRSCECRHRVNVAVAFYSLALRVLILIVAVRYYLCASLVSAVGVE